MKYRYNPLCRCSRCRMHGFMGPVILITLGVLFLFDQMLPMHHIGFDHSWPLILIVIGLMSFLKHSASTAGHVPREYGMMPPPVPGQHIRSGTVSRTRAGGDAAAHVARGDYAHGLEES